MIFSQSLLSHAVKLPKETGIDALACAFGTAHGIYLKQPKLDFERLAEIKSKVDIPLVMHGGSGVSHEDYRRVIELGIRKINYYTYMAKAGGTAVASMEDKTFYHDIERITKNLFAVISLDLNDLKKINDTLGHLSGDKLIVEFSNTVTGCLVSGCKLYRIGGDEFIVLVTKKLTMYDVEDMVNNIEKELEQKKCSCAIGIAYALDNDDSFDHILKRADELMYQDKAKKKKLA